MIECSIELFEDKETYQLKLILFNHGLTYNVG